MFFARPLFSLLAVGAVSAVASSAPAVPTYDKDITNVVTVIVDFQDKVHTILPEIDALANAQTADEASVSLVVNGLVQALGDVDASIKLLEGKVNPAYGGKDVELAEVVAVVYADIATCIGNLKVKKPHLYPVIVKLGLDVALFKVLLGLNIVVAGVLKLVAGLLATVGGVLGNLSLTLIVNLLGYYGGYGY